MNNKEDQRLKPQVDKNIYFGERYLKPGRFASYGYQLQEIMALQPGKTLEIGIGNGVVSHVLKKAGVDLTTVDFDNSLEPDVVASVTELPFEDKIFDIVACFEVLEHLPYEQFSDALAEIRRVCRSKVIISLPDVKSYFRLHIPVILSRRLYQRPFSEAKAHCFNGEHYWEINKKGYPLSRISKDIIRTGYIIESTYRVWEMPSHRFFRLSVGSNPDIHT